MSYSSWLNQKCHAHPSKQCFQFLWLPAEIKTITVLTMANQITMTHTSPLKKQYVCQQINLAHTHPQQHQIYCQQFLTGVCDILLNDC